MRNSPHVTVGGLGSFEGKQFVKDASGATSCEILFGSLPTGASFNNILLAGTRGLQHLVVCAVTSGDITLEEMICKVIDCLSFTEHTKIAVACLRSGKIGSHD